MKTWSTTIYPSIEDLPGDILSATIEAETETDARWGFAKRYDLSKERGDKLHIVEVSKSAMGGAQETLTFTDPCHINPHYESDSTHPSYEHNTLPELTEEQVKERRDQMEAEMLAFLKRAHEVDAIIKQDESREKAPDLSEGTPELIPLTKEELRDWGIGSEGVLCAGKVAYMGGKAPGKVTSIQYALRHMAWERAKGELMSMLWTWEGMTEDYEWFEAKMQDFIECVEERI